MTTDALIAWGIRFAATSYNLVVVANSNSVTVRFPNTGTDLSPTTDYYVTGDGQSDDVVSLLATAIQAQHGDISSVVGSVTSGFRVSFNADVSFDLQWANGSTTLVDDTFGFDGTTGAGDPHTGTLLPHGIWRPQRPIAIDSRDRQPVVGGVAQSLNGDIRVSSFGSPYKERETSFIYLPQERVLTEYASATEPTGAFEYGWVNSIAKGRSFRLYGDETDLDQGSSAYTTYRIRDIRDPMFRSQRYQVLWDVKLMARRTS